jgi:hypothetical protein
MRKEIFVFGAWLDSKLKENTLIKNIKFVKSKDYPTCLVTHYPVSTDIQKLVDYYIYDSENILSENWWLRFWRINEDGTRQEVDSPKMYHGLTCLMNMYNAISLLLIKKKFKYIHFWENGSEYNFDEYMQYFSRVIDQNKVALFFKHLPEVFRTDIFSIDIETFRYCIPNAQTWKEYTECGFTETFVLENWFTYFIKRKLSKYEYLYIPEFEIIDSWLQSDNLPWEKDPRGDLEYPENLDSIFKNIFKHLYDMKKDINIFELYPEDNSEYSVWNYYVNKYGGIYLHDSFDYYNKLHKLVSKLDVLHINAFTANKFVEAQLHLIITAISYLNINGLIIVNNQLSMINRYLTTDKRFFAVSKNEEISVFRKDLEEE